MYQLSEHRFDQQEIAAKNKVWQVLCRHFFQKFIPQESVLLDLGSGYCEFINHIQAKRKIACEINAGLAQHAAPGVEFICTPAFDLSKIPSATIDVVFISNVLEHLASHDEIWKAINEAKRILKHGGKLILLHPNIRYVKESYWDFFDHHVPLTELSLKEVLEMAGFEVLTLIAQFLPYSTKSGLPKHPALVRLYLALPFLWKIFGGQSFIVARKN